MTPTLFGGDAIIMTLRRGSFWPNGSQGQCIVEDRAPQPCVIVILPGISDRSHSYNLDAWSSSDRVVTIYKIERLFKSCISGG